MARDENWTDNKRPDSSPRLTYSETLRFGSRYPRGGPRDIRDTPPRGPERPRSPAFRDRSPRGRERGSYYAGDRSPQHRARSPYRGYRSGSRSPPRVRRRWNEDDRDGRPRRPAPAPYDVPPPRDVRRPRPLPYDVPENDGHVSRDRRGPRDFPREGRRDFRDFRNSRDFRDFRDGRDDRDSRDARDSRGGRDFREGREGPREVVRRPIGLPPAPPRPQRSLPVRVRPGPRPGTLARRNRSRPAPLAERVFVGCSPLEEYDVSVKLGQGTFGEVKQAIQRPTGRIVALKKVTIYDVKDGLPITALREIKLLKLLNHPSIISVVDMAYRPSSERGKLGEVFMVEPYMDHDLNGLLENPNIQLPMTQIKLYMRELLEGTLFMHQNNILHRDMKAANLLIDNHGQLQIADFGLARPYYDPGLAWSTNGWKGGVVNYTDMVVTRWYRPPELLAGQRNYGPPIDMWGVGCILAEMVIGRPIFKGASEINQLELISQLCGSPNEDNFPGWSSLPGVRNCGPNGRPEGGPNARGQLDFGRFPRVVRKHFTSVVDVGPQCADLIDRLLTLDPTKRITAAEALEHEWFWTKPYPADPATVPKYLPSKEIDRNRHRAQASVVAPTAIPAAVPPGVIPPPGIVPPRPTVPPFGAPMPMPVAPMARPPGPPPPIINSSGSAYPPKPRLSAAGAQGGWNKPAGNPHGGASWR